MVQLFFIFVCFLIEIIILIKLYKNQSYKSIFTFVYLIAFYYCNSVFIDLLISDKKSIGLRSVNQYIDLWNPSFFYVYFSYFIFLLVFGLLVLFKKPPVFKPLCSIYKPFSIKKNTIKILVFFSISFLIYISITIYGLDRMEKKEMMSTIYWYFVLFSIFTWLFSILVAKNKGLLMLAFTACVIYYSIYSFERELILLLIITALFYFKNDFSWGKILSFMCLSWFILTYWKSFYVLALGDSGFLGFKEMLINTKISFSGSDPIASYMLIYDYFDKCPPIYDDFYLTYITLPIQQLSVIFKGEEIRNLGEVAQSYYTGGDYGLAFSMILESILNFGMLLGPILLALGLFKFLSFLLNKFYLLRPALDVILIVSMVTFTRSDFLPFLKIYLIPLVLIFLVFNGIIKRQNEV